MNAPCCAKKQRNVGKTRAKIIIKKRKAIKTAKPDSEEFKKGKL